MVLHGYILYVRMYACLRVSLFVCKVSTHPMSTMSTELESVYRQYGFYYGVL